MKAKTFARLPLMLAAIVSLVAGVWGGLLKMGWKFQPAQADWLSYHGPLMVCGFLGTLIGLERAVAHGQKWCTLGPVLTGAGSLLLVTGMALDLSKGLIGSGSLVLAMVALAACRRHLALFTVTMAAGVLAWVAGNVLWLQGREIVEAAPWWASFLILTIAGERLELSRVLLLSRTKLLVFTAIIGLLILSLLGTLFDFALSPRCWGASLAALAAWLLLCDVARRTVRQTGLTRFIALCLLVGYGWLGLGGALWISFGQTQELLELDAAHHALFLGFIFSMIFAHVPIVLPSVLGVNLAFSRWFYLHVGLLHASLIVRIGSDLAGWSAGRMWSGLANSLALVLFLLNTLAAIARARKTSNADVDGTQKTLR